MLSPEENRLLLALHSERIEEHLARIASFDRLSGSKGEEEAVRYIEEVLSKAGIRYSIDRYPMLLSNPRGAELRVFEGKAVRHIPAKTRSFSGDTGVSPRKGTLRWIDPASLFTDPFLFHLGEKTLERDLEGLIVCTPVLNPIQVLQLEKRGAVASIQVWEGKEELIHEGINDPVWGTPTPDQLRYYTNIPLLVISQKQGEELKSLCGSGRRVEGEVTTKVEASWYRVPQVEAEVGPQNETLPYVLLGCHLDSWYKGATDNGTGNALVLAILEILQTHGSDLRYPVKAVFWSGHSNGRYAGSAAYARSRFLDLWNRCLGYINIDMPGLRGATDYTRIASGPELYDAAFHIVREITGQEGTYVKPVRGWDQSFQNIGVSPFFVWASTLPKDHPDCTANSFMSYWWHTEEDLLPYHDPRILLQDGKIYTLAAYRLGTTPEKLFKPERLLEAVESRLLQLEGEGGTVFPFSSLLAVWRDFRISFTNRWSQWSALTHTDTFTYSENVSSAARDPANQTESAVLAQPGNANHPSPFLSFLRCLKLLNRLYYTEKEGYTQDFALEQEALPGLSRVRYLQDPLLKEAERELLLHYLHQQGNRFLETLDRARTELAGIQLSR